MIFPWLCIHFKRRLTVIRMIWPISYPFQNPRLVRNLANLLMTCLFATNWKALWIRTLSLVKVYRQKWPIRLNLHNYILGPRGIKMIKGQENLFISFCRRGFGVWSGSNLEKMQLIIMFRVHSLSEKTAHYTVYDHLSQLSVYIQASGLIINLLSGYIYKAVSQLLLRMLLENGVSLNAI